jgi:hypothetical protein
MGFAENMRAFADEVVQSAHARTQAVTEVHQEAHRLLSDATSFMAQVAKEHHERADHVNTTLAESRRDRQDQVRTLRHTINERLNEVRAQTEQLLTETRNTREQAVSQLMSAFTQARTELNHDLQEARRCWRNRGRS